MYQKGELIIYGGEGVCRVEGIGPITLSGKQTEKVYYTLSPLFREGTVYTPVDTTVFMRPIISKEEAHTLIKQIPSIQADIYENRNLRFLNEHYQSYLQSHDCADLVQLIKAVYAKKQSAVEKGKKIGQTDARYMKRAEDMLHSELAVALGIDREQVVEYIDETIKENEKNA